MTIKTRATIEDLYRVEGKAEIVNGEITYMSPTGEGPIYAAGEIFASLREYAKRTKYGRAVTDGAGFQVDLPNRESFSPDAAFIVSRAGMTVSGCGFSRELRFSPSRCAAKATMAPLPNGHWPKKEPTISPRAPASCGT